MKSLLFITLHNKWELQIYWPNIKKTEFGYCLSLNNKLVIGKKTFAICVFGLGFGCAQNELNYQIHKDKKWGFE